MGVLANESRAGPATTGVKVPRRLVVETYGLCRQAERSVDKVLGFRWPEFTAYYRGNRAAAVKRVVAQLQHLAPDGAVVPAPSREDLTRNSRRPGLFEFLFGKWVAARKEEWLLPTREIGFTAAALQALVQLIAQEEKPEQDRLVELRMDLWAAQWLLEGHCYGLPELGRAVRMEHFRQSDHLVTVTLADLIQHLDGDNEPAGTNHEHP